MGLSSARLVRRKQKLLHHGSAKKYEWGGLQTIGYRFQGSCNRRSQRTVVQMLSLLAALHHRQADQRKNDDGREEL